jgi:hypothetical protein
VIRARELPYSQISSLVYNIDRCVASCNLEVADNMSIGEALLVLFVLHGQADNVPIREQSHAYEATTEVPTQNEDSEDR